MCEWASFAAGGGSIDCTPSRNAFGDASILSWRAHQMQWRCAWGTRPLHADRRSSFGVRITLPATETFLYDTRLVVGVSCDPRLKHELSFGYGITSKQFGVMSFNRRVYAHDHSGPRPALGMVAVSGNQMVSTVLTVHTTDTSAGSGFSRNEAVVGVLCDFDHCAIQFFLDDQRLRYTDFSEYAGHPTYELTGPDFSPFVWPIRPEFMRELRPYFAVNTIPSFTSELIEWTPPLVSSASS